MKTLLSLPMVFLLTINTLQAQQKDNESKNIMKTYVIERVIPNAGNLTPKQLKDISQTSCSIIKEMGSTIQWQHSYVTGDKVYCVYKAESKALVKEHAKKGNFPANCISEVKTMIGPETAKQ